MFCGGEAVSSWLYTRRLSAHFGRMISNVRARTSENEADPQMPSILFLPRVELVRFAIAFSVMLRTGEAIRWAVPVLLAIVLLVSSTSAQTTIHVPADVSTIQGAIQSASNGDTVLVAAGTYRENIDFLGKAITVEGASAATTILQGGSAPGAVVRFISGEGRSSILSNFTIQDGVPAAVPDAGGILVYRASPTIRNNIIQKNTGCGIGGFDSSPLIAGNLITGTFGLQEWEFYAVCRDPPGDNSPPPYGPNYAQSLPGNGSGIILAGLPIDGRQAQIVGNTIENNSAYDCAGGIWLSDAGAPLIENNIIANNYSYFSGAIQAWGNVAPIVIQNLVYDNIGDSTKIFNPAGYANPAIDIVGYGLAFGGITAVFAENTVVNNQALYQSYFVEWQFSSQVYIETGPSTVPIYNNIIIGEGTLPALTCGGDFQGTLGLVPQLSHNDILVTDGGAAPASGSCAGQIGTNGNISADPLFASTDTSAANPFQLQLSSPAVDAGDNNAPDLPSEDILGHPRIQNARGLPSAIIDMGVYEYPGVPAPLPPPDFTLQVAPSSLTLGSSAQGEITVTLTPNSAFTGPVALSCGSLPATLSCSFRPQSVFLTSGIMQTATLVIAATTQANSSSPGAIHGISAISSGILFSVIFILPPLGRKKHARQLLALCILALVPLLLSSCADFVLTPHGQPASYSITVIASSSSVQSTHTANVLVTVQ
jgi:parallel beta-helix repeat protein